MPAPEPRAQRIMDTAADLIVHWGYKRITVEEIAKRAGVGKGTVYLHFATRESLFLRILLRESSRLVDELLSHIRRHPTAVLPAEQARLTYLTVFESPLLRAMFTHDVEMLGTLASDTASTPLRLMKRDMADEVLRSLREHGLVRTNVDLRTQRYTLSAIQTGFYLTVPLGTDTLTVQSASQALAETISAAMHTQPCADREVVASAAAQITESFVRFQRQLDGAVVAGPHDDIILTHSS